jgi:hypothetical protein
MVEAYLTAQQTRRRGIRCKQLLFVLKEKVRYCNLQQERLRFTSCRPALQAARKRLAASVGQAEVTYDRGEKRRAEFVPGGS